MMKKFIIIPLIYDTYMNSRFILQHIISYFTSFVKEISLLQL